MADETDVVKVLWQAGLTAWGVVTFYFYRRDRSATDKEMAAMKADLALTNNQIAETVKSITDHKVYAANTYAKESALTAAIREFKEDVNSSLKDIRDDIKTILRQTK